MRSEAFYCRKKYYCSCKFCRCLRVKTWSQTFHYPQTYLCLLWCVDLCAVHLFKNLSFLRRNGMVTDVFTLVDVCRLNYLRSWHLSTFETSPNFSRLRFYSPAVRIGHCLPVLNSQLYEMWSWGTTSRIPKAHTALQFQQLSGVSTVL